MKWKVPFFAFLDDVGFAIAFTALNALDAHAGEIDCSVGAINDELGYGVADCRALLQSVTGETIGEIEIRNARMFADDPVLILVVIVIVPDPGVDDLEGLERRNAGGKKRPDAFLEPGMIDLPIHLRGFFVFRR